MTVCWQWKGFQCDALCCGFTFYEAMLWPVSVCRCFCKSLEWLPWRHLWFPGFFFLCCLCWLGLYSYAATSFRPPETWNDLRPPVSFNVCLLRWVLLCRIAKPQCTVHAIVLCRCFCSFLFLCPFPLLLESSHSLFSLTKSTILIQYTYCPKKIISANRHTGSDTWKGGAFIGCWAQYHELCQKVIPCFSKVISHYLD